MRIVIDSIIRRMISDFFCKEFLIFSNFVCIFKSSLFNRVILRILFIYNLFIIFLMIMIFRIFRSTLSSIKIVNSRICFVVLKLIDLFATIDLITNSRTFRKVFVKLFDLNRESFFCSCLIVVCMLWNMLCSVESLTMNEFVVVVRVSSSNAIVLRSNASVFESSTIFTRWRYFFIFVFNSFFGF